MNNDFLIITSSDIDDGKRTPKKFDIYDKKDKIEDNYILLGKRKNLMKKKNILEQWNFENKLFNASLINNSDCNKEKNNINYINNEEKKDSQSTTNTYNKNSQTNGNYLNKKQFIINEIKNFNFDEEIYKLNLNPNFKIHLNNH
jgi:hypothetical protein